MRAWQVGSLGELTDVLALQEVDDPRPGPGEVRVKVLAAGVNFADVLLCRGQYQVRPPLPFPPGIEMCGEVLEVGDGVTRVAVGQRVVGSVIGTFAEQVVLPAEHVLEAPASLTDAEAAVLAVS